MARSLRFERTGNEVAILMVFVSICCFLGAIIQVSLGEGFNFVALGFGFFVLVLARRHQQLRNKKERAGKQEH